METNETRGQRIRRARKERGLTQAELARAVGIAVKTLASIEADNRKNHPDNVAVVMAYLDLPGVAEETQSDYDPETLLIMHAVGAYVATLTKAEKDAWVGNFIREITGKA